MHTHIHTKVDQKVFSLIYVNIHAHMHTEVIQKVLSLTYGNLRIHIYTRIIENVLSLAYRDIHTYIHENTHTYEGHSISSKPHYGDIHTYIHTYIHTSETTTNALLLVTAERDTETQPTYSSMLSLNHTWTHIYIRGSFKKF